MSRRALATTSHAEAVRRFYRAWNERDWSALAAMLAPNVEWLHVARGETVRGQAPVVALIRSTAEAFPEARVELTSLQEAGTNVIAECVYTKSPGRLLRPTAGSTFCEVHQWSGGRCLRGTTYGDTLGLLLQLDDAGDKPPHEHDVRAPGAGELDGVRAPDESGVVRAFRFDDAGAPAAGGPGDAAEPRAPRELEELIAAQAKVVIRERRSEPDAPHAVRIRMPAPC